MSLKTTATIILAALIASCSPSRYSNGVIFSMQYSNKMKSVLENELIDKAEYKDQGLRDKLMAFREALSVDDGPILIEIALK